MPVFEGYALPHAIHTTHVAGQDVTMKLCKELENVGIKKDHLHIVRDMKEKMCHVPQNYKMELKSRDDPLNQEQRSYELPSGDIVEVNQQKRISAAEVIFDPKLSADPS